MTANKKKFDAKKEVARLEEWCRRLEGVITKLSAEVALERQANVILARRQKAASMALNGDLQ